MGDSIFLWVLRSSEALSESLAESAVKSAMSVNIIAASFRVGLSDKGIKQNYLKNSIKSNGCGNSSNTTSVYTHPNLELAREYINKLPTYSSGKKRDQGVTKLVISEYI
jgi:hypothetical protein